MNALDDSTTLASIGWGNADAITDDLVDTRVVGDEWGEAWDAAKRADPDATVADLRNILLCAARQGALEDLHGLWARWCGDDWPGNPTVAEWIGDGGPTTREGLEAHLLASEGPVADATCRAWLATVLAQFLRVAA
jgi:hypothetical protein